MQIAVAGASGGIGSAIANELSEVIKIPKESVEAPDCDVLVLVSGVGYFGPLEEIDNDKIRDMEWINFERHILLVKSVLAKWKERRYGHIIFVGSNSAYLGIDGNSVYGATKAALLGFARGIQAETRKLGIKVSVVSPGTVNTDFWKRAGRDNRIYGCIEPQEIGRAVRFVLESPSVVTEMIILPKEKI